MLYCSFMSWTQSIHAKWLLCDSLSYIQLLTLHRYLYVLQLSLTHVTFMFFLRLYSIIMLYCLVQSLYKATLQLLMLHRYLYVVQLSIILAALCCFKVYSHCMLYCLVQSLYKAAPLFLLLFSCGTQLRLPYNCFILLKCGSEVMLYN